jgi:hypothetical protein
LEKVIGGMRTPTLLLAQLGWRPIDELATCLDMIRNCLDRIRRLDLRGVRVAGMIEPQLMVRQRQCNVHAHIVIDTPLADSAMAEHWRSLTGGMGYLGPDPERDPCIARGNIPRVACYVAKRATWCPTPGELPLHDLGTLLHAVHGQQFRIDWGRERAVTDADERRRTVQFFLGPEMANTVDDALAHAKQVIGRDDPSAALSLVALDYLLAVKRHDPHAVARLLPQFEHELGVRLIALDPLTGHVAYGAETAQSAPRNAR